jgi:hypothetical protein
MSFTLTFNTVKSIIARSDLLSGEVLWIFVAVYPIFEYQDKEKDAHND